MRPSASRARGAWHARSPAEAADALGVEVATGLAADEARRRLDADGPNPLPPPAKARAWRILIDQFASGVVLLLLFASALALVFRETLEGFAILAVVALNGAIGFATEVKAVRSKEALRRVTEVDARARRDCVVVAIPASGLVRGDVVLPDAGDLVPAVVRLVDPHRFETDESALPGESFPVEKSSAALPEATPVADQARMAFQRTGVTRGSATVLVVETGARTRRRRWDKGAYSQRRTRSRYCR